MCHGFGAEARGDCLGLWQSPQLNVFQVLWLVGSVALAGFASTIGASAGASTGDCLWHVRQAESGVPQWVEGTDTSRPFPWQKVHLLRESSISCGTSGSLRLLITWP